MDLILQNHINIEENLPLLKADEEIFKKLRPKILTSIDKKIAVSSLSGDSSQSCRSTKTKLNRLGKFRRDITKTGEIFEVSISYRCDSIKGLKVFNPYVDVFKYPTLRRIYLDRSGKLERFVIKIGDQSTNFSL